MQADITRRLLKIHRLTGLVVSLAFALFAITGVLLVFHEQIDDALGVVPKLARGDARISLARAVEIAQAAKPDDEPLYVFADEEEYPGMVFVGMAHASQRIEDSKPVTLDVHRGELLGAVDFDGSFSAWVFRLHAQLLLGPGGSLLVGALGVCLLVTLVTGAIVYGPVMRRFRFATLRRARHLRTFLADVHKLIGVATFGWNLVVVATGILLSIGSLLIQYYAMTELKALAGRHGQAERVRSFAQLDAAIEAAEQATGRAWSFVALPGSDLASPRHYTVLLRGGEGLSARMLTLAMVDAVDADQVVHRELPWYLRAVLISEPLHFGDYGGMPLKVLWTLFALASLGLTGSGVWSMWAGRRARGQAGAAELASEGLVKS